MNPSSIRAAADHDQAVKPAEAPQLRVALAVETMAGILRQLGYRAELSTQSGQPQLHSATQGLGFLIGFGSPVGDGGDAWLDCFFHCPLSVRGEVSAGLVERWNQRKRHARLFQQDQYLILAMDVLIAGGVTDAHLRTRCELWDRLMRDFVLHLKQGAPLSVPGAVAGQRA